MDLKWVGAPHPRLWACHYVSSFLLHAKTSSSPPFPGIPIHGPPPPLHPSHPCPSLPLPFPTPPPLLRSRSCLFPKPPQSQNPSPLPSPSLLFRRVKRSGSLNTHLLCANPPSVPLQSPQIYAHNVHLSPFPPSSFSGPRVAYTGRHVRAGPPAVQLAGGKVTARSAGKREGWDREAGGGRIGKGCVCCQVGQWSRAG